MITEPVVSEKSYSLITDRKYTFKVHKDAHKTQIRQAVEEALAGGVVYGHPAEDVAVALTDAGLGDYWDDVEQYARNGLIEAQLTDRDEIRRFRASEVRAVQPTDPAHAARLRSAPRRTAVTDVWRDSYVPAAADRRTVSAA